MLVHEVAPNVTALSGSVNVPTMGAFPVNAFFLGDGEPTLVDVGSAPMIDELLEAVEQLVDLTDLRWIYLTHCDRDHTGAMQPLLERAPNATVALTLATMGYMATGTETIPLNRASIVTPGVPITLGGREITPLRPPTFDNGGTVGFLDHGTGAFYSSDFLGAILPTLEEALADDAAAVAPDDFALGTRMWTSFDSPWVHVSDQAAFEKSLDVVRDLQPSVVLPTHGPPVRDPIGARLDALRVLPGSESFAEPDMAVIEAAMARLRGGDPAPTA